MVIIILLSIMYYETFDKEHVNNFGDKIKDNLYKEDPNYIEIKRKNFNGSVKKIGLFRSGTVIRNAITGIKKYEHIVGTNDECLYFKIKLSSTDYDGQDPLTLFFDSPKQCEDTLFISMNADTVKKWNENRESYISEKR